MENNEAVRFIENYLKDNKVMRKYVEMKLINHKTWPQYFLIYHSDFFSGLWFLFDLESCFLLYKLISKIIYTYKDSNTGYYLQLLRNFNVKPLSDTTFWKFWGP